MASPIVDTTAHEKHGHVEGHPDLVIDQRLVRRGSSSFVEWSTDSSRIAALVYPYVYVLNADGTGLHRLSPKVDFKNLDCSFPWSPDGQSIAFTHTGTAAFTSSALRAVSVV